MNAIAASYHDTVNVLQGVRDLASSPFDRPEWFGLLASRSDPVVALARDGEAMGALALTFANGRLEPLRNWYSFTWRQLVASGQRGDLMLETMARGLRTRTHRVTLWPVPDEDGSATRLTRAFSRAGWSVRCMPCDENHVLPVGGRAFAEYWSTRPGRMRTTLKRKAKKVEVEILTRFDPAFWEAYETIYDESWKPAEGDKALLRRFAEDEGQAGRIRLALARHEGIPVAAQFWTVENDVAYIHKLAHSEAHASLSAGTTLTAALFERVIDTDRVEMVDFGTGSDSYKSDWMEQVRPRFMIDCLDAKQVRAWPPLAKRLLRPQSRRLAPERRES